MWIAVGQGGIKFASHGYNLLSSQNAKSLVDMDQVMYIDSEPKTTIAGKFVSHSNSSSSSSSYVLSRGGCGNCWAMGYSLKAKQMEDIVESIRKRLEHRSPRTLTLSHSLGGGTGSGLISSLLEQIFDDGLIVSKTTPVFAHSILPFSGGESPLQSYNTILCLAHIHEFTDANYLWSNDEIYGRIDSSLRNGKGRNASSFQCDVDAFTAINQYAWSSNLPNITSNRNDHPWTILERVCPEPRFKWIGAASTAALSFPSGSSKIGNARDIFSDSWNDLAKQLRRIISPPYREMMVTARASREFPFELSDSELARILKLEGDKNPSFIRSSDDSGDWGNSLNCIYNGSCLSTLHEMLKKARSMFQVKAYLHWYDRYYNDGISPKMDESINCINDIVQDYCEM